MIDTETYTDDRIDFVSYAADGREEEVTASVTADGYLVCVQARTLKAVTPPVCSFRFWRHAVPENEEARGV